MSLVLMESCDPINALGYNGKKWTKRAGGLLSDNDSVGGRKCWNMRINHEWWKDFPAQEHSEIIVGFRHFTPWVGAASNTNAMVQFYGGDGSIDHVKVAPNSSGGFNAYRGTTQIGQTVNAVFPDSSWFYVQVRVLIDDAVGEVEVQVDKTNVLNLTGVDTRNGGTDALIDRVRFGSNVNTTRWRDIFIATGDGLGVSAIFPRPVAMEAKYPMGAGALTGLTPNTGSNWAAVDETNPDGDTTYVAASAVGQRDSYQIQDAVAITQDPVAVQAYCIARYQDSPLGLGTFLRRSGVNDDGGLEDVAGSYDSHGVTIWEDDPIAAGPWTLANFNATEFGLRS